MSRPKISVILPVYNVEDYLTETLNSISAQTIIDDIEVIMVDDGSTDESRYIIERYALDYENFHAYHKENEGQGIARNFALKLAEADYIHFMDSDDYLPQDAYEKMYNIALKNSSDMVIGNVLRFARYNAWQDNLFRKAYGRVDKAVDSASLEDMPSMIWDTITCNKLYRRQFLLENGLEFPNKKISFEDIPFSLESYILADSISITPEVWYYWRLRSDNTSTTQQDLEVKSLKDRLEILDMVHQLLLKYDVSDDIVREEYLKWTNHDLKFFIKRFDHFPQEHHRPLFDEIRELVSLMPDEIIDGLNSYKRAIFTMLRDNDFEGFMALAPLEDELCENPHIPEFLNDKYKKYFDFNEAFREEELFCEVGDVNREESGLSIGFTAGIFYLTDEMEYELTAELLDNDGKAHPLEADDNRIFIPAEFIRDKRHSKVRISYGFDDFVRTAFMKNRQRKSIEFDEFYLDLNTGIDSHLYIDIMEKSDNLVEIDDIAYGNGEFILKGTSKTGINEIYIENVIGFERVTYPIRHEGPNDFSFTIPKKDLLDAPIKKWEINCISSRNSVRVSQPFEFYERQSKTRFINSRNKILIENDVYNSIDEIYAFNRKTKDLKSDITSLKSEKSKLTDENDQLKSENAKLNERISEFKSRKIVRMADKFKLKQ